MEFYGDLWDFPWDLTGFYGDHAGFDGDHTGCYGDHVGFDGAYRNSWWIVFGFYVDMSWGIDQKYWDSYRI